MLGIAAPAAERLDWNLKALAAAAASSDERARGWAASLHNNIGWTYFERGDPKAALDHWQKALPLQRRPATSCGSRVAKWTVARGYRALGRLDDAKKIQLALAAETEAADEPGRLRLRGARRDRVRAGDKDSAADAGRRRRTRCSRSDAPGWNELRA